MKFTFCRHVLQVPLTPFDVCLPPIVALPCPTSAGDRVFTFRSRERTKLVEKKKPPSVLIVFLSGA